MVDSRVESKLIADVGAFGLASRNPDRARVIEHMARIRIHLPTSCPEQALFRQVALGLMPAVP